jgi:hypothetical protein
MKRLLLSTLSFAVIAVGGTSLAAQDSIEEGDSDWKTCFDACMVDHDYHYCRADCKVFEPDAQ